MLAFSLAVLALSSPQDPNAANLEAWRAHLLPREAELRWESIPWESTFAAGLRRASEEARPLLFWAMNGHPLGCT